MKQVPCINPRLASKRQCGDALLEALIGILLMSVIGLGLSFALARTFNTQRYISTQNIAILQMKNLLPTSSISQTSCASSQTIHVYLNPNVQTTTDVPVAITCSSASNIVVGITGNTSFNETISAITRIAVATPANNANAKSLFGGDGIVSLTQ